MSTPEPVISHLTQQELSEKDKATLAQLETWLSKAEFEKKKENIELCVDKELNDKWALLRNMDFIKKFTRPLHQIIRVTALSPSIVFNPKGPPTAIDPTSMTPMRVLQGNPTISEQVMEQRQNPEQKEDIEQGADTEQEEEIKRVKRVLPLVFGWTTYITEEVEVTPALDILVVTSQPLTSG